LGFRPWFALLRRARSLRRFAFAMGGRLPPRVVYALAEPAGGWRRPVLVATSTAQRRRGLRPRAEGRAMLFVGRSVHGVGMREDLAVVFLDRSGTVLDHTTLRPGRVVSRRRARFVVELPAGSPAPAVGSRLVLWGRPKLAAWRDD